LGLFFFSFRLGFELRLGNFAVAQGLYHFKDFRPSREWSCVFSFILIDGLQKFELLIGHLAFLGGFAVICPASAGAAPAVQAEAPIDNTFPAVFAGPLFYEVLFIHLSLRLRVG
jgi:hypothetical protein